MSRYPNRNIVVFTSFLLHLYGNTFGKPSGIDIHWNNIENSGTYGVWNKDSSTIVNATYNLWGDPSGPYHPTSWTYKSVVITNPDGKGDQVSDYVLYEPWLMVPFQVYTTLEDLKDEINELSDEDGVDLKKPAAD